MELITLLPLSQGELQGHQEKFIDGVFAERLPIVQPAGAFDLKDAAIASSTAYRPMCIPLSADPLFRAL
jgi:hypothetical protein